MEDKRKRRYVLAVYLIIALLAVVFILMGNYLFFDGSLTHELLINLASDLIGVVLLFFIINQVFFIDQDRDPRERLERIISTFERKFAVIDREEQISKRIGFPNNLKTARTFSFLALDASRILKDFHQEIVTSVVRGTHVQLLLLNSNSEAADLFRKRISKYGGSLYNYSPIIELMFSNIRESSATVLGSLEVRVSDWIPSCRIMAFDIDTENGAMMVNIYPLAFNEPQYKSRFSIFLTPNIDNHWYQYFHSEYNKLWKNSTEWEDYIKYKSKHADPA